MGTPPVTAVFRQIAERDSHASRATWRVADRSILRHGTTAQDAASIVLKGKKGGERGYEPSWNRGKMGRLTSMGSSLKWLEAWRCCAMVKPIWGCGARCFAARPPLLADE